MSAATIAWHLTVAAGLAGWPAACPIAAQSPGAIRGQCYYGDADQPATDVHVVLYSARTGLMLSHTYTSDNGDFTLPAPARDQSLLLIASTSNAAHRREFRWKTQKTNPLIKVRLTNPVSSWNGVSKFLKGNLQTIVTLIIGFFFGLATKSIQDRRLFSMQIGYLKILCADIIEASTVLQKTGAKIHSKPMAAAQNDLPSAEGGRQLSALRDAVVAVEALLAGDGLTPLVIYPVMKDRGIESYHQLRQSLDSLRNLASDNFNFLSEDFDRLVDESQKLANNKLLLYKTLIERLQG